MDGPPNVARLSKIGAGEFTRGPPWLLRILVLSKSDLAHSLQRGLNFLIVPVTVVTGPSYIRQMGRKLRKHIKFAHLTPDSEHSE